MRRCSSPAWIDQDDRYAWNNPVWAQSTCTIIGMAKVWSRRHGLIAFQGPGLAHAHRTIHDLRMATAAIWGNWNVPDDTHVIFNSTRSFATPKWALGGVCGVESDHHQFPQKPDEGPGKPERKVIEATASRSIMHVSLLWDYHYSSGETNRSYSIKCKEIGSGHKLWSLPGLSKIKGTLPLAGPVPVSPFFAWTRNWCPRCDPAPQ